MVNGTQMTLEQWMPDASPKLIAGASDSPVRTYPLPESSSDLLATARACFSELCTFLDNSKKKIDPTIYSSRTLKICCLLMEDGISPEFSLKWTGGAMMQNGKFSILKTSEFPKTEKGCLLSDILEEEVDEKYFLSEQVMNRLILR